jgi:hypothetical protein
MVTQLAINFDWQTVATCSSRSGLRLARNTDPVTSHMAAAKIEPKVGSQCAVLWELVKQHPGLTSAELARLTPWPADTRRFIAAKRLSVLRDKYQSVRSGETRKCRVTGEMAMTWWPIRITRRDGTATEHTSRANVASGPSSLVPGSIPG